MTHELRKIVSAYETAKSEGTSCVLATVVALDGSSYRRPGVRMLLQENGTMTGAVSGGCVEKEVFRQAISVFSSKLSKIMTYDGRYRLGCEGILYILLEPFEPDTDFIKNFWDAIEQRTSIEITSHYQKQHGINADFGSIFYLNDTPFQVRNSLLDTSGTLSFEQSLPPCFKLVIIGSEHDAVQLCSLATMTGWEVTMVVNPREDKSIHNFPGASDFISVEAEVFEPDFDAHTAVVLMTHSYVKDLQFLIALRDTRLSYLGLLGPSRRREKLFNELLERYPEISETYLELIHGPAGIHIGAETPQEIAISVMAEILSVVNKKEPILLKAKGGSIHS